MKILINLNLGEKKKKTYGRYLWIADNTKRQRKQKQSTQYGYDLKIEPETKLVKLNFEVFSNGNTLLPGI